MFLYNVDFTYKTHLSNITMKGRSFNCFYIRLILVMLLYNVDHTNVTI